MYLVTDVGVQRVASGLHASLRVFACEGCYRVHAAGLAYLPLGCRVVSAEANLSRRIRDD